MDLADGADDVNISQFGIMHARMMPNALFLFFHKKYHFSTSTQPICMKLGMATFTRTGQQIELGEDAWSSWENDLYE